MGFDYDDAMNALSTNFSALARKLWPGTKDSYEKYYGKVPDSGIENAVVDSYLLHRIDTPEGMKMYMLDDLKNGIYWHATDAWKDVEPLLSEEEKELYCRIMVEQAIRREDKDFRYSWIVRGYDEGILDRCVTDDLLKEAENRGFEEVVKYMSSGWAPLSPSAWVSSIYDAIMNHSDLIDPCAVEIKDIKNAAWVDERYLRFFESVRDSAPAEAGAMLALPIIKQEVDSAIQSILSFDEDYSETMLDEKLSRYRDYISSGLVQEYLRNELAGCIDYIGPDDGFFHLQCARLVARYLDMDSEGLAMFVSSAIPMERYFTQYLDELDFPDKWLTEDARHKIRELNEAQPEKKGSRKAK